MRKYLALLALFALPALAQTIQVPAPSCTAVVTCKPVSVSIPATPVTPPANPTGALWIYNNGVFTGAGDCAGYSYGSGKVTCGKTTVTVTGDEGWQPRMPGDNLDTTGYSYVTVSIMPTQTGNTWVSGAEMIGDVQFPGCPSAISIMKYGPNPAIPGQWNVYKIPLSALCITPALHPYKIMFLEQSSTNRAGNSVQFNALGFLTQ